MIRKLAFFAICFSFISCETDSENKNESEKTNQGIVWQKLNQTAFDQAGEQGKLVLLEVGANWCHWCHVMDDSTYSDLKVQRYLNENFILCREDQDARPDLYAAYRKWGWPAIIIFNAEGEELLKLRGYQHRKKFLRDLKAIRKNPEPLTNGQDTETKNTDFSVSEELVFDRFIQNLDHENGGYNWSNKSLQLPGMRHALRYSSQNDSLKKWLDLTVKSSFSLVDPVWSGVYQYSAKSSWDNQHFEKLLRVQASYIEAYSLYGNAFNDNKSIEMAEGIIRYCDRFLGNETPLYWNSQNADLISGVHSADYYKLNEEDRLAKGIPKVDETIYLKENAAMVKAIAILWAATGNDDYLKKGIEMLNYILDNFKSSSGLYCREEGNETIISFEDNRRLLDVLITYYQITGNKRRYFKAVSELGMKIMERFDSPNGIQSAFGDLSLSPTIVPRNNIEAVLTFNTLGHLTKKDTFLNYATSTYNKMNKTALTRSQTTLPYVFSARQEIEKEPFHALFISDGFRSEQRDSYVKAFLTNPDMYFIFEELVVGEMDPADEAFYGSFDVGTLFMCTSSFCSAPIYELSELEEFLQNQMK